ncbi:MAG: hypothetical protein WEB89_00315 [Balneolales bacterium]
MRIHQARILGIMGFMMLMLITWPAGTVIAQFSEEEELIAYKFVTALIEQVNGYILLSESDEHFMKWLIGLYDYHDASRARWQINNMLVKYPDLKKTHPWEYSERLDAYITQLLIDDTYVLTVSFSEHLNGFAVISHENIQQDDDSDDQ